MGMLAYGVSVLYVRVSLVSLYDLPIVSVLSVIISVSQLLTIQPPGSTRSSSYLSLSSPPVSSSLKFCNRSFAYAAALWNGLPKDLRQFAHPPNRALNFTYPPLALSSVTFHSRLKTELFKISYPGSTSAPRHVRHRHLLQP